MIFIDRFIYAGIFDSNGNVKTTVEVTPVSIGFARFNDRRFYRLHIYIYIQENAYGGRQIYSIVSILIWMEMGNLSEWPGCFDRIWQNRGLALLSFAWYRKCIHIRTATDLKETRNEWFLLIDVSIYALFLFWFECEMWKIVEVACVVLTGFGRFNDRKVYRSQAEHV